MSVLDKNTTQRGPQDRSRASAGQSEVPLVSPLDRPTAGSGRRLPLWSALAVAVHALIVLGAWAMPRSAPVPARSQVATTQMVEVDLTPPPEEAPEPEPEPEPEPPPKPVSRPKPVKRRPPPPKKVEAPPPEPKSEPKPEPEPEPAPEAAEAAEILTKQADAPPAPAAPKVVSGNAVKPVGGYSAGEGTAQAPVRSRHAVAGGVPGGRGVAAVDRSRPPRLAGGAVWDCAWPEDGDLVDEDVPTVILQVKVDRAGQVRLVKVLKDPGYGFGQEARRCALRKRWQPALDRTGQPIEQVARVAVRFNY